ncbi:MAG TPA: hypothetical protein VM260_14345 [Pirellula sp.]|nr:hypothetical protein [Pirellula sp.]
MAEKARILLRYASEVKFIDPHFAGEKKHTDFIIECVKTLRTWRKATRLPLEIHFHFQPSANEDLESRKSRSLPVFDTIFHKTHDALSKQEMELSLFQWSMVDAGDRFHERTVVTDCGCIELGGGLDSGNQNEKTSVKLMSSSVREELRQAYKVESKVYDLLHHSVVS